MSYIIESSTRDGLELLTLLNEETEEMVEVIASLGGMVHRLRLKVDGVLQDVLFHDTKEELQENPLFRGRILFPFNDRIPKGRYTFEGQDYQLGINCQEDQSAIHGMVYDQAFELLDRQCDTQESLITLGYSTEEGTFRGYPFQVSLRIHYILRHQSLKLVFQICNEGQTPAPVALGWHPYFTLGKSVDDAQLLSSSETYVEVDEALLPTRSILPCKGTELDFSNGSSLANKSLDVAVSAPSNGETVLSQGQTRLTFAQDTDFFKYTQLYTPDDRQSIAIEPVSGATNAFNFHELGLQTLAPGQTIETWASVIVA